MIKKIFAWFQIITGGVGLLWFGVLALIDVFSGYRFGHGFIAIYGMFFYIPISLWFLTAGFLLLRAKLIGYIMSVVTLLFLGINIFLFAIRPTFLLPSQSSRQTLAEDVKNIQLVNDAKVYYLSTMDVLALHLYCDERTLNRNESIDKITIDAIKLIKKICPKAKNYKSLRIIFHPYVSKDYKGPTIISKDIYFIYDKKINDFVKK